MKLDQVPVSARNLEWHISANLELQRYQWLLRQLDAGNAQIVFTSRCVCHGHFYDCTCETIADTPKELCSLADSGTEFPCWPQE